MADAPQTTPKSTPAGLVWIELLFRQHDAVRAGDERRVEEVHALIKGIETEFPDDVEAEKALRNWKEGAV